MSVAELARHEPPGVPRARMMLQRAHWAATAFARYDNERVWRIVEAVAERAYADAEEFGEWAVRETGMGVAEHKRVKNELCSKGIVEAYRGQDFAGPRIDASRKLLELPHPAGVVFALAPSTNPVSTINFKILLSLMTRNAIVVSPHPLARECCVEAARRLAAAAVRAGAPDGAVQVVEEPTIPLIESLMADETTDVILATGGTAVVRAAYRSGNPAIGVGPGNVPALVDATADLAAAARKLIDSKAFDNSILCTNESVAIVEESVAAVFAKELQKAGGHVLDETEVEQVRERLFPAGRIRLDLLGKDASALAAAAELRVPQGTRVLVAPFALAVPEEPLAREKLFPLLGLVTVPDVQRGIQTAQAVLRIGGAGHSAVIHSRNPHAIMAYGVAVPVLRVAVNVGGSTGSAGFDTALAPSMTIGTGFYGRSSVAENLEPAHLVQWTRVAYASDRSVPFDEFEGIDPWSALPDARAAVTRASANGDATDPRDADLVREEIRRIVVEELRELVGR